MTNGKNLLVGFKQSLRAIEDGKVQKVLLALDCEDKISAPIRNAAAEHGTEIEEVPTMKELGTVCGIDVKASCAVVFKF